MEYTYETQNTCSKIIKFNLDKNIVTNVKYLGGGCPGNLQALPKLVEGLTVEEIEQIAKFAESLRSVRHLHLLPYHRFGLDKYKGLGREYSLNDITTPSNEHMEMLKKAAEKYSIEVQIGG
jgi:uncharacterized protein (TIGR03905 family)